MAEIFQLHKIVYEEPSSIYFKLLSGLTLLFLGFLGISELLGNHLKYSKFWNSSPNSASQFKVSSVVGMFTLYAPASLAGLASFLIFPDGDSRFLMVKLAVTIHFLKRVLEVLFIHKYSGGMMLDSVLLISSSYLFAAAGVIYIQSLTRGFPEPPIDLKYIGFLIFLVGISGNFYHHYLLSRMRGKNEKGYKIPQGGFFGLVVCPHYLFEIIAFVGISFISQTLFTYCCAVGIAVYLTSRSFVTRKWYLSKFENFPKNVKALIPYVF